MFSADVIQPSIEKLNKQILKNGACIISAEMILAGSGLIWVNGRQMTALTERISDDNCTPPSMPFHQCYRQQL